MEVRQDGPELRSELRPDVDDSHQAALLIDFDNVTMGIRSNLGQELRNLLNSDVIRGKVAVQRAYADWRRYPQYIVPLSEASIDLIFAPAYGSSKKNATDIRLAIDALELVFIRPEIKTFILMSGDSDFSSLVLKLKEYGKYIIGVGIQESSSDLLVQNCDEYYSYSALSGLSKTGDQPLESHDPWVLTGRAVAKMVERGDTMRSDRLKQVMLEIDPSFNEKEQGFNKFNRFVVEAASRGLLSIQKMENGQYGVAPPTQKGTVKAAAEAKPERRESRPRRGGEQRRKEPAGEPDRAPAVQEKRTQRARPKLTMKSALDLLNQAVDALLEGGGDSVRDSDVKRRLLAIDPAFDEGELGYSKFSKFLQAAEAEGAVVLTRGPNGNYQVGHGKAKRGARRKAAEPEAAEPGAAESAGETTMKRLARFLFGASREEPDAGATQPQAAKSEEKPQPATGAGRRAKPEGRTPERGGRRRAAGTPSRRGGRRPPRERDAEAAGRAKKGPRPPGRAPRGETSETPGGRGRRGEARSGPSRRGGERTRRDETGAPAKRVEEAPVVETAPSVTPQPRVEPPAEPVKESPVADLETVAVTHSEVRAPEAAPRTEKPAESDEAKKGATPAPLAGAPRGTIRGRWGSRGRYRPSQAPPPILEGQSAGRPSRPPTSEPLVDSEPDKGDGDVGDRSLLSRLKDYPGVGGKTAETLVEAFGSDVFRVLDQEPDRVRELLSDHRAERVLAARRKELEAGSQ